MKKTLILALVLCFSSLLLAQTKKDDDKKEALLVKKLDSVATYAIKERNPILLDDFFQKNLPQSNKMYAFYYQLKAYILTNMYQKELTNEVREQKVIETIAEILKYHQLSIDTCKMCSMQYTRNRFNFLTKYNLIYEDVYKIDSMTLKNAGYKFNYQGLDLFVNYSRGKSNWFGIGFSAFKVQQPYYSFKVKNSQTGKKDIVVAEFPKAFTILPISYNYDFRTKTNDINASLFQLEAPFYVNFTKFGIMSRARVAEPILYYRPEIGFGTGNIAIVYSYNVKLQKKNTTEIDRHLITLRFSQIFKKTYF
jgi:hypothetical protein